MKATFRPAHKWASCDGCEKRGLPLAVVGQQSDIASNPCNCTAKLCRTCLLEALTVLDEGLKTEALRAAALAEEYKTIPAASESYERVYRILYSWIGQGHVGRNKQDELNQMLSRHGCMVTLCINKPRLEYMENKVEMLVTDEITDKALTLIKEIEERRSRP